MLQGMDIKYATSILAMNKPEEFDKFKTQVIIKSYL